MRVPSAASSTEEKNKLKQFVNIVSNCNDQSFTRTWRLMNTSSDTGSSEI